jgi:predicted MPP superfamily phosphohydrolase
MGLFTTLGLRRSVKWDPPTLLDHLLSSPLTFITIQLYYLVIFLLGRPVSPPRDKEPIRVVSISDTHDQTVSIPPGDVLIHAGDLTDAGTAHDIQLQLDWLKKQPHPVKIVIAGNHDSYFDPRSRKQEDIDQASKLDLDGITYLENSSTVVEIKGRKLNIFGAPDIPKCGPSSFA